MAISTKSKQKSTVKSSSATNKTATARKLTPKMTNKKPSTQAKTKRRINSIDEIKREFNQNAKIALKGIRSETDALLKTTNKAKKQLLQLASKQKIAYQKKMKAQSQLKENVTKTAQAQLKRAKTVYDNIGAEIKQLKDEHLDTSWLLKEAKFVEEEFKSMLKSMADNGKDFAKKILAAKKTKSTKKTTKVKKTTTTAKKRPAKKATTAKKTPTASKTSRVSKPKRTTKAKMTRK